MITLKDTREINAIYHPQIVKCWILTGRYCGLFCISYFLKCLSSHKIRPVYWCA